jgi:hypothetical protein
MADDFVSDSNDDEDDLTALIPNITEHMKNTENLNKCKTTKEQEEKHDVDLSRKTKPERRHSSSLSLEYRNNALYTFTLFFLMVNRNKCVLNMRNSSTSPANS